MHFADVTINDFWFPRADTSASFSCLHGASEKVDAIAIDARYAVPKKVC